MLLESLQTVKTREEQEFLRNRKDDDMEMSDSEDDSTSDEPTAKKKKTEKTPVVVDGMCSHANIRSLLLRAAEVMLL